MPKLLKFKSPSDSEISAPDHPAMGVVTGVCTFEFGAQGNAGDEPHSHHQRFITFLSLLLSRWPFPSPLLLAAEIMLPLSLLVPSLALASSAHAATAGSFAGAGSTLVSAMMVSPGSTFPVHHIFVVRTHLIPRCSWVIRKNYTY